MFSSSSHSSVVEVLNFSLSRFGLDSQAPSSMPANYIATKVKICIITHVIQMIREGICF